MRKNIENPPFSVDVPEKSHGLLLFQTTTIWQKEIKRSLEEYNVSHSQFVLLASLLWFQGKGKELGQNDLIELSKLDKMTVSKSLRKMVEKSIVERSENKEDTRAKIVSLTKKSAEF